MKISEHCYCVTGLAAESPWAVNAGFIVGHHTTMIIDTGSNYLSAQTIHGYAQSIAPNNKMLVVNTEPHFDHIGGNCYFQQQNIEIFAHSGVQRSQADFEQNKKDFNATILNTARKSNNESDAFFIHTSLANPTRSLINNEHFNLGSVDVTVYETPGHTPFNISLFAPRDQVLFCSDTVVNGYLPNLECGDISLWNQWLHSLYIIESLSPATLVTGHGQCLIGADAIEKQLSTLKKIISKAIAKGEAPTR